MITFFSKISIHLIDKIQIVDVVCLHLYFYAKKKLAPLYVFQLVSHVTFKSMIYVTKNT